MNRAFVRWLIAIFAFGPLAGCGDDSSPSSGSGASWENVSPPGTPDTDFPFSRYRHAMAYDPVRGVVVLFGGLDTNTILRSDTWEWNGSAWSKPATGSTEGTDFPWARRGHAMAYDANAGGVVIFGGDGASDLLSDTWVWDGTDWADITPSPGVEGTDFPTKRENHAMAWDSSRSTLVLFGGQGSSARESDTWELSASGWAEIATPGTAGVNFPEARDSHGMAYDPAGGGVILFGGYAPSTVFADTWTWKGTGWTEVATPGTEGVDFPDGRQCFGMAHDADRGIVVLFGGNDGGVRLADTWEWNATGWSKAGPALSPAARDYLALAFEGSSSVVLFGGYPGGASYSDETWEYR